MLSGLFVALLAVALVATAAWAGTRERPTRPPLGAAKVDRDGDKVFDELETKLAAKGPNDRLSVIVMLREAATSARVEAIERAVGPLAGVRRFSIIDGFSARATKGQVRALSARQVVAHVEEDSTVHALNDTAQDAFGVTKARIDAPGLDGDRDGNPASYSKNDLVAAVIDTGIDNAHHDLDGGKVLAFKDFVGGQATSYDDNGHGTHVAATIAGDGDALPSHIHKGVAPAAALVGIKVLDRRGNGSSANVLAGIQWATDNKSLYGIEAVNLSLGIAGCSDGTDADSVAVNNARDAGLVVAVAAGNEGPGTCTIGSPGAAAKAITAGAMADFGSNGFYQAYFSSRGKTADGRIKPDVSAPGVNITSAQAGTTNGYAVESGTSMATPFVAGLSLLMLDANPALTPQQVKDDMTGTAIDWGRGGDNKTPGTTGLDIDYGAGRLDGYAALQAAGAPISSPPDMPVHFSRDGTLSGAGDQDDYPIAVTDTTFPVAATMIIPALSAGTSTTTDFDLFLFDPNGNQVASSEFITRQEDLGFKPTLTGTYTLRVKSFSGSGGYFVDVSTPRPSGYPRPQAAALLRVPLTIAYKPCAGPNRTHNGGLTAPSCNPTQPESSQLTVGTLDANGKQSLAVGFARLTSACNPPAPSATPPCTNAGDQADVRLEVSFSDVRKRTDLSDYPGELQATSSLRITDKSNGPTLSESATVQDVPFGFTVPCATTPLGDVGSTCSVSTYADAVTPGAVPEGKRSNWELGTISVFDGGPDGSASTQPNTLFARQGVFIP
jgi:serine protease AprX